MERLLKYLEDFGGTLTADEVARVLRLSLDELNSLTERQHLVALRHDGDTLYPALQFHDAAPIPHLAEILDLIPSRDPVAMLRFLVSYDPALGTTRAEALISGHELDLVRSKARQVNEQIAW